MQYLIAYCHNQGSTKECLIVSGQQVIESPEQYHQLVKELLTWHSVLMWTKLIELNTGKTLVEEYFSTL